jgi:hypothetical protein
VFVQSSGRSVSIAKPVNCPDGDTSVISRFVNATLECGAVVQITGRFDNYYSVRTAKGDAGVLPFASVVVLKDRAGAAQPAPAADAPARERMHYDERATATAPARASAAGFTLLNNTPVRVKLIKSISSATAHVGDAVELEVLEDVLVEGVPVLVKGSKASGLVAEAETKKRLGHGGKIALSINSVRLADGQQAKVRGYQEASGTAGTSVDGVLIHGPGKDVAILQGVELTVLVDGDVALKREAFVNGKDGPINSPEAAARP